MFKYGQCPPTIKVIFLFSGNAFYAAKRLDIGIAIPKEGRFANARNSRFQAGMFQIWVLISCMRGN